jgi:hypothetical protein
MKAPALLRPLLLGLLLPSLAACGVPGRGAGAPRTTSAALDAPPAAASLEQLRARESAAALKDFRVRAADGAIELHVKSTDAPRAKHKRLPDGTASSVVDFAIGSDVDVTCQVTAAPLDLAHWVEGILTALHAKLIEAPKVEVEVVEGHPVLLVHTEAVVQIEGASKRHIAKFAAAHFDRGSVACVHDAVGYEATFREAVRHVVGASRTPDTERPAFRAVTLERDGERVIGFEEQRVYRGAKFGETKPGESRQMMLASAVLTRGQSWTTADAGWSGIIDGKGVLSERSLRRVGPATVLDMTLERKSGGLFTYQGTVDGQAKKGSFKSREPLVTTLSRAPAMAAFARDASKKEIAFVHFDEEEPTAALRETFRHEGPNQLGILDRGKSYHCVVDGQGMCAKLWREGSTFTSERLYATGSP